MNPISEKLFLNEAVTLEIHEESNDSSLNPADTLVEGGESPPSLDETSGAGGGGVGAVAGYSAPISTSNDDEDDDDDTTEESENNSIIREVMKLLKERGIII